MKIQIHLAAVTVSAVLAAGRASADDGWTLFDGGWRVSGGAVYNFGVKTDMKFTPQQRYVSPFRPGLSKKEARDASLGTKEPGGTKVTYPNGAWIDMDNPAAPGGDVEPGKSWNLMLPKSAWNGDGTFDLGSVPYSEVQTFSGDAASIASSQNDDSGVWGASVELSRNLYHNEEYRFGLDLGFAVQYFKRNGLFDMFSSWCNGRSTCNSGAYAATADLQDPEMTTYLNDPGWADFVWQGDPPYFGAASYGEGASPSVAPKIRTTDYGSTRHDASYGSLNASGDYENLELMLMLQPYYDVFDWMSINGTLGVVASRQAMEMSFTMLRGGAVDYRSNKDFSQWDAYGVAGLGLSFNYKGFVLSGDFLARFLDRDLEVQDRYYSGSVERGTWMFRMALGYEF